uniref:FYVE-type domain-containing protein n=1 Tax=Chrysotila carterae TaxID=13221 RepID=A0A7S4C3B4_CHRCT
MQEHESMMHVPLPQLPQLPCSACICCASATPLHWVPDAQFGECSGCAISFNPFVIRRHHCRLCGRLYCADCADKRTSLPGWGIENSVRVCTECFSLETRQLPMLLAGDVWFKQGNWTGARRKRYVWLSPDQQTLYWAPMEADTGFVSHKESASQGRSIVLSAKLRVEVDEQDRLVLQAEERLLLEPSRGAGTSRSWQLALERLLLLQATRRHHERVYGGVLMIAGAARESQVALPSRLQQLLAARQARLMESRQRALASPSLRSYAATFALEEGDEARREAKQAEERQRRLQQSRELREHFRRKYGLPQPEAKR